MALCHCSSRNSCRGRHRDQPAATHTHTHTHTVAPLACTSSLTRSHLWCIAGCTYQHSNKGFSPKGGPPLTPDASAFITPRWSKAEPSANSGLGLGEGYSSSWGFAPGSWVEGEDEEGEEVVDESHKAIYKATAALDASSVPSTPIALKRGALEYTPLVPGTLNGIGHPILNDEALGISLEALEPVFVLKPGAL